MIARVQDKLLDASVRYQLQAMKEQLLGEKCQNEKLPVASLSVASEEEPAAHDWSFTGNWQLITGNYSDNEQTGNSG